MQKTPFPALLRMVAGLSAFLLLAGCFETKQEFTLNPDGSGKVVHESTFQEISFGDKQHDPEQILRETVVKVMKESKGVDAWRDVSFKRLDDGRVYFKGTAYFKSLSALSIPNQTMLDFNWDKSADGHGVLSLREKKNDSGAPAGKKAIDPATLSPEERTKKIKEDRIKFQQMKPMMAGILGTMKHEVVLHLPGKVVEVSNFSTDDSGALHLKFDGARLLETMDKLVNDDAWMAKNSSSLGGDKMPWSDSGANEMLFGAKAPVRAVVSNSGGASFDYAAEVAAAAQESPALQKDLGPQAAVIAAPAQGGELKEIKIIGARFVLESDEKREIQPFNGNVGFTLALRAEMPGSIFSVDDGASGLDTAVADDGTDLLPESESSRKFSFPKVSADKSAVLLEAELKLPGAGVKGLKELSGHLHYTVSTGSKETALGFSTLKAGAKGTALGARIKTVDTDPKAEGSHQLEVDLEVGPSALKALYRVIGGAKTELKRTGYSGTDSAATFTFESETAFSAKDRLVAEVYDQMQSYDAPFKLENVTFLGAPLEAK